MTIRKRSLTATTRAMTRDLDDSFADLVSTAFLYAGIADRVDARDADKIRASMEWRLVMHDIGARIAEQARREDSWLSQRPRAV